jgi:hypothetical protein
MLAVLSTLEQDHRAAIVNISSSGARLSAPSLPAEGEEVIFNASGVSAFGRVVWAHGAECGVAFDSSIIPAEVERLRSQVSIWSFLELSMEDRPAVQD